MSDRKPSEDPSPTSLADRLALSREETAQVLGISLRMLGEILPELPHLYIGRRVLFPVDLLRRWLEERAEGDRHRSNSVADQVLQAIRESNDD